MEMKEFGPQGGGERESLAPPGSANGIGFCMWPFKI